MLRIVVVEDDPPYRIYLEGLLRYSNDLTFVQSFDAAQSIIAEAGRRARQQASNWDLALVALELNGMGGLDCIRSLKSALPDLLVVALSRVPHDHIVLDAIRSGADGFLLKHEPADQLLVQLRAACSGGAPLSPGVALSLLQALRAGPLASAQETRAATRKSDLTTRELQVLRCLTAGRSYKATARELHIGVDTVRTHVRSIYAKLGVHTATEAVIRAVRDQLV